MTIANQEAEIKRLQALAAKKEPDEPPSAEATRHAAMNLQLAMVYRSKVAYHERLGLVPERVPTCLEKAKHAGGGAGVAAIKIAYTDPMSLWELNGMSLMHDGLLLLSYWYKVSMPEMTRDQINCILEWAPSYIDEWENRKRDYLVRRKLPGTRNWSPPRRTNLAHRKQDIQDLADSIAKPENYSALRMYIAEPNLFLAKNIQQSTGIATRYLARLVDNGFTGQTWPP
jgi:hypothetical protein